ncbi:MAG: TolC family protein [Verrucomicrobiota bacterium]|nr:TolC family protein [Verrucomicrobiota bacterium]
MNRFVPDWNDAVQKRERNRPGCSSRLRADWLARGQTAESGKNAWRSMCPARRRARHARRLRSPLTILLGALLLSGCATYHPKPLPPAPDLVRLPALMEPASRFHLPGLSPHPFNPAKGLDETTVVTLAVVSNPELKAARLRAGVARAQVLEAGLLPDPLVSGGFSRSPEHTGYSVGLREDLQALITRGAAKAAARAHAREVNLEILWQEWQVAERAQELFIRACANGRLLRLLTQIRDLFANRCRRDQAALKQGNAAAGTVATDLAALAETELQRRQLQLQINQTRHDLNSLLGLEPDEKLHLIGGNQSRPLSSKQFQAAVAAMPHRRADLLALQAGYLSQEQRLREAILAQFPAMSAGVEQARSAEEGIHTIGFTVNVTLPLFNRNRGQIALQRATRAVLYQTYEARLDQAVSQADQIWKATRIMSRQLHDFESCLPPQQRLAAAAERSFRQGNLDLAAYVSLKASLLSQQAAAVRLRVSLARAQSALEILLGLPPAL